MEGQRRLQTHCRSCIMEDIIRQEGKIISMLLPDYENCNYEEKTISLSFCVSEWGLNRIGILHSGIVAAAFDYTTDILARFYAEGRFTPAVGMEIKFIRPLERGDKLLVHARALSIGREILHFAVEGRNFITGDLTASGSTIFFLSETRS